MCMKNPSLSQKIFAEIKRKNYRVFSCADFAFIAPYKTISKCLERLVDEKKINRLSSGLYARKEINVLFGEEIKPTGEEIAEAIARKFGWRIIPSPASALNLLGFSTQIPACLSYASTGPYKTYYIGGQKIVFRHSFHKDLANASFTTSLIAEAMRALGKNNVPYDALKKAVLSLDNEKQETLLRESPLLTPWIAEMLKDLVMEEEKHEPHS
jgi:hypothetical protein